jgi:hypothetical protein
MDRAPGELSSRAVTALDSRVHHAIVRSVVDRGFAPDATALAARLEVPLEDVEASLGRLHDGHGLVLHPGTNDVWIVHPFSLSPTAVWVAGETRGWWAPCLWCAFGVQAVVGEPVTVHVRLGGESEAVTIDVGDDGVFGDGAALVAHFPRPPRHAWDNVVHVCASRLPFRDEGELDDWCRRHHLPRGVGLPMAQLHQLARRWYGRHLAEDWVKWTPAEAAAIFASVGLTGPFWSLDLDAARF